MSGTPISGFPAAAALGQDDLVPIIQNGLNRVVTGAQLNSAATEALTGPAGAGAIPFDPVRAYPDGSVGAELARLSEPLDKANQRSFLMKSMWANIGDLKALVTAIAGGTVRVAFASDSIIQGDADGLYDNSCPAIIMRTLREQNPGVTFIFGNFSIAGLGIHSYSDLNYKGMAPPADPAVGFYRPAGNAVTAQWPGGSVVGKAWADHVKDFAPDLVFTVFSANDIFEDSLTLRDHWKAALTYMGTWAKPPSVAIGNAGLPSTVQYQDGVQRSSNVVRTVARELGYSLLDINRLYHYFVHARDVDNLLFLRDPDFTGFPSTWNLEPGTTLNLSTPGVVTGQGAAMRPVQSLDILISADVSAVNWATTTIGLRYGSLGTGLSQYTAFVSGSAVSLYWGATELGVFAISPAIPNGTSVNLMVRKRGGRHEVFLNGNSVMDKWDYGNLLSGTHGVTIIGGVGAISNFVTHLGNYYEVGTPEFTLQDTYGVSSEEFATNLNSVGGNGINHYTKLGNSEIVAASFLAITERVRLSSARTVQQLATVRTASAEDFAVASTTLQTEINGVLTGYPTGVVVTPTGAFCSKNDAGVVNGGTTITVKVFQSFPGTYFLSTNVTLPPGRWLLNAASQFSKTADGTVRNSIVITGVRVA